MTEISITPLNQPFIKALVLPGSKSITNRALLLSALARGTSTLSGVLDAADTQAMITALQILGIEIVWNKNESTVIITGHQGVFPNTRVHLNCHDAGTVSRFLLAACANQIGEFHITGSARLCQRPHAELIDCLRELGAVTVPQDAHSLPLIIQNKSRLTGGTLKLNATASSQYLSALLMIAPYMQAPVTLLCDDCISPAFVAMTVKMMRQFGVEILQPNQHTFMINQNQHYLARSYTIEPDLSTASYFFAAAALTSSNFTLPQVNYHDCLQGDVQFVAVLQQMGCEVIFDNNSISVTGTDQLRGIVVDMNNFSDTFMSLAVIAPFASSPVTIKNIAHTRQQESDRISAVAHNLECLNIRCDVGLDYLTIYPGKIKAPAQLSSFNDHRIAMAFSLLSLKTAGINIDNTACVNKTCPTFFKLLGELK